jgi:poly(beta-D-mannuronate) lyase
LSIAGFEAYTGSASARIPIPDPNGINANTKITLNSGTAKQSSAFGSGGKSPGYPAIRGLSNGNGPAPFSHTNKGVGQWWEVQFNHRYWVGKVRILNRKNCCGQRLARTKVFVNNQYCGQLPGRTGNG